MTKEAIEKLPEVMKSMTASSDYMTESRLLAVNFDRFSKYYCQVVKIAQQPKTNDALYCTEDGKWYFVEFKNGSIKKDEIYRKIYDSLIMLIEAGMIPDYQFSRENISYILDETNTYTKEQFEQLFVKKFEKLEGTDRK